MEKKELSAKLQYPKDALMFLEAMSWATKGFVAMHEG
jgi:hypothetical protein